MLGQRALLLLLAAVWSPGFLAAGIVLEDASMHTATLLPGSDPGSYADGSFEDAMLWQPQGGDLVPGSSIMLLADTQNHVIRKVDWGRRLVTTVVGNATGAAAAASSNCLDGTCQGSSFQDGTGLQATLNMPYSVRMHHLGAHAFVADTRSNAVRIINLYTLQVATVIRNIGYPTDVVSWPGGLALCDGQNNSIWVYYAPPSGMSEWPRAGLTLLSGANTPVDGLYAESSISGAGARFWEPLSITYDARRGSFYVADYRNRVIRSVHPTTGATSRAVGDASAPVAITDADNAPGTAVLAGPTALTYHASTDAVYFSDRNPSANVGAVRVWHVATGRVRTLVGQSQRAYGDGAVLSPLVGAGAAWGVVVGEEGGWIGWSEADTGSLRSVVAAAATPALHIPCPPGEYPSTEAGACVACDPEAAPEGTVYIAAGLLDDPGSCGWRCPNPPMHMPFTCPAIGVAVASGQWGLDDQGDPVLVCMAGFQRAGAVCEQCSAGRYCDGTNADGVGWRACPAGSESGPGAVECSCSPGAYLGGNRTSSLHCCSDNSRHDEGGLCSCSAGFRDRMVPQGADPRLTGEYCMP